MRALFLTYIIQREAPRCSFYSDGHMPEPRSVERATDTDPRAFFVELTVSSWVKKHRCELCT